MSIDLIRNRPVFDTDILKKGIAIKVKEPNYVKNKGWRHAIIIGITLTDIEAVMYDGENNVEVFDININDVTESIILIEILK